jgi:formate-dependent nitrite reductase cytochrome c552 subunit
MLNEDGGIREVFGQPVCLICHAKIPDPRIDRAKDVLFRADIAFLCWRCHAPIVSPILNQHFLTKPSITMLKHIEHNEQKMEVIIPLVPRDRLTCSTCHNPHQEGVIKYEPSAKGADSLYRLRLLRRDLCYACHRM